MPLKSPRFSVIVTTYNRQPLLERCLASLLVQDFPQEEYEIIVVDDGSGDMTSGLLTGLAREGRIRYLHQENCGWAVARNTGLDRSRGEIIVFTDDDCRVPIDWLRKYDEVYRQNPVYDGVAGSLAIEPGANLAGKMRHQVHLEMFDLMNASLDITHDKAGEVIFCYGANRSFRRTALEDSFFDTELLYFDDYDLNLKLREEGIRIYYDPEIRVFHHYVLSARDRILADYRFGRSSIIFEAKHPDRKYLRPARGSITRLLDEYKEEPVTDRLSYVAVQGICRLAREWGRLKSKFRRPLECPEVPNSNNLDT
jgi:glycosyltransferase involved in cell wall biosynthesis